MKVRDKPYFVVVLNIWKDEPTYHAYGDALDVTRCGRTVQTLKPSLPFKHAKRFAKPCKGCFAG